MNKEKLKKIITASYAPQSDAKNILESEGYTYDPELSTMENKVFVDANGNPNIAFRGSKRIFDDFLGSDLKGFFGLQKYDKRFQEAKHLKNLVENKYNKTPDVFGHSLGGMLAEYTNQPGNTGKVYTVNKFNNILDMGKTIPNNQTDYKNAWDIVSLPTWTQKYKYGNLKQGNYFLNPNSILKNHKYQNI